MLDEVLTDGWRLRAPTRISAEIADCVACGAPTALVPTAASDGKQRLPVDPEPDPEGALVVRGGRLHAFRPGSDRSDVARYRSHFASCPFTARFQR